ncbi:MAG: FHS family L-fucose permease-like MFS transporter [Arenicella sp.]|jgi:FHS family L-fucose permease-like MFS transporter
MWGFITVMNDFLINTFSEIFTLGPTQLSFIQLSFFGAFFCLSLAYFLLTNIFKKDPINSFGYKNGMALSLLICGLGCANFYLAADARSYPQFIASLFILAAGVTFLQICANPYVSILGTESTASKRLNLAQGLNSLGTTLGPIVGNLMVFSVFAYKDSLEAIGSTYLIYGSIFVLMAAVVKLSKLPSFSNDAIIERGFQVLKHRNLRFGILAIFFYVGSEVAVGSWIGKFAKDPEVMAASEDAANSFLAFFWGGLMIGRLMASISLNEVKTQIQKNLQMLMVSSGVFILIWMVNGIHVDSANQGEISFQMISLKEVWIYILFLAINYIAFILGKGKANRMLVIFSSINLALLLLAVLGPGKIAFWSVLGTGLFFSIGWSNIFSLSIKGLGKLTSQGSSLLVMAIAGGAVLPFIQSNIIESYNVQISFIIPAIGMLYLIFFGLNGYKRE